MKSFIVKRVKDGEYLSVSERDIDQTLAYTVFNGTNFEKQFELVGEEKDIDAKMSELFG